MKAQNFDPVPRPDNYPEIHLPDFLDWNNGAIIGGLFKTFAEVTPDTAERILKLYTREGLEAAGIELDAAELEQSKQRHVSPSNVNSIAAELSADAWKRTDQSLKFTKSPCFLVDGQHRLHAVIKAGKPAWFDVAVGLEHSTFEVIDTNKSRSAADALSAEGVANYITAAGAARLIINYHRGNYLSLAKSKGRDISNREIIHFVRSWPTFERHCARCLATHHAADHRLISARIYSGLSWLAIERGHRAEITHAFFERIYDGLKLENEADPIYKVRRELLRRKMNDARIDNSTKVVAYLIKAFNAYTAGETLEKLTWKQDKEPFPEIRHEAARRAVERIKQASRKA